MYATIKKYCNGCENCQQDKVNRRPLHAPLHPHDVPSQPWENITCDIIGPITESNGYDAIIIFVDRLTKQAHFEPIKSTLNSKEFIEILQDRVIRYHGVPKIIISDPAHAVRSMYIIPIALRRSIVLICEDITMVFGLILHYIH